MAFLDFLKQINEFKKLSNSNKSKEERQQDHEIALNKLLAFLPEEHKTDGENHLRALFAENESDNQTLYQKILPLCELGYLYEKNGDPKKHATKLATIFNNEKSVITYLIKFGNNTKPQYLVHDACLFDLPKIDECEFDFWKKKANEGDNMLNPGFRKLLPHAKAIEEIINSKKTDRKKDPDAIKKTTYKLVEASQAYKKTSILYEDANEAEEEAFITATLKDLAKQKHQAYLELAELYYGTPLKKMTILVLQAFYERYKTDSNLGHALLVENGISEKDIGLFYTLARGNDDTTIPNIIIAGKNIGYPDVYIKKLNILNTEDAAIAACLGVITNCCQYLGGAGTDCVRHGISSPNGGFYVLCKGDPDKPGIKDPILAQAWAWKGDRGGLCLDSIEIERKSNVAMVSDMYRYLGFMLSNNPHITRVNTGNSSGITKQVGSRSFPTLLEKPIDYDGYRDSVEGQLLLADSTVPYLFLEDVSEGFRIILQKQSINFFTPIFQEETPLIDSEPLKQAINFALDTHKFNLLELLSENAGDRLTELKTLINAIIHDKNKYGQTVLHNLAMHPDLLKTILKFLPEEQMLEVIKEASSNGITALHQAVKNPKLLKEFLELLPADKVLDAIFLPDSSGQTVSDYATTTPESKIEIFKFLPENQVIDEILSSQNSATLLQYAAKNPETLKKILELLPEEKRLDAVKMTNCDGTIIWADAITSHESLKLILELYRTHGELNEIMVADEFGFTILHYAASDAQALRILLQPFTNEQNLNNMMITDKRNETPLQHAAAYPESLKVMLENLPPEKILEAIQTTNLIQELMAQNNYASLKVILEHLPLQQGLELTIASKLLNSPALNDAEFVQKILEHLPSEQKLDAIFTLNDSGWSPMHHAYRYPKSLQVIFSSIPTEEIIPAIHRPNKHGRKLIDLVQRTPDSLKLINELIQEHSTSELTSSSTHLSDNRSAFFKTKPTPDSTEIADKNQNTKRI